MNGEVYLIIGKITGLTHGQIKSKVETEVFSLEFLENRAEVNFNVSSIYRLSVHIGYF